MNTKKKLGLLTAVLCYSVGIAGAFYLIGYQTAYGRREPSESAYPQTFYATVSDIQGDTLTAAGMEVNDVNFRGDFRFSVRKETKLTWHYTDIALDDLDVGDHISITFTGEILETAPGQIEQVEVIQLLDDEP